MNVLTIQSNSLTNQFNERENVLKRVLRKIGSKLHGRIGHLLYVLVLLILFVLSIFVMVFKLPVTVCFKGEITKSLRLVSISFRMFLSCFINIFSGTKSPKCIGCGTTDFLDKKDKNGYVVGWAKQDEKTGRAICTDCKDIVDFIE